VESPAVRPAAGPETFGRLDLIQIFRGLAATLVVLYHASTVGGAHLHVQFLNDLFHFGHCGVDFFFVLSGFIILHAHYDQNGDWKRIPGQRIRVCPWSSS
jgi:peptidoglycan/LPS O-acetylase OafA/YrhL